MEGALHPPWSGGPTADIGGNEKYVNRTYAYVVQQ